MPQTSEQCPPYASRQSTGNGKSTPFCPYTQNPFASAPMSWSVTPPFSDQRYMNREPPDVCGSGRIRSLEGPSLRPIALEDPSLKPQPFPPPPSSPHPPPASFCDSPGEGSLRWRGVGKTLRLKGKAANFEAKHTLKNLAKQIQKDKWFHCHACKEGGGFPMTLRTLLGAVLRARWPNALLRALFGGHFWTGASWDCCKWPAGSLWL